MIRLMFDNLGLLGLAALVAFIGLLFDQALCAPERRRWYHDADDESGAP